MLKLGKHKGHYFSDVVSTDPSYCLWVLREHNLYSGLSCFRNYLRKHHGGILEVGKHRGATFQHVLEADPEYADWAVTLPDPSESLKSFATYCSQKRSAAPSASGDDEERAPKRLKKDECKICMNGDVDGVLVSWRGQGLVLLQTASSRVSRPS